MVDFVVSPTTAAMLSLVNPEDPDFSEAGTLMKVVKKLITEVAKSADILTGAKNTILASKQQMETLLGLSKIWDIREQIMRCNWPTDPATQAKIIQDLAADAARPPLPLPAAPQQSGDTPGLVEVDAATMASATASAQKILDGLRAAQAASDASPAVLKMAVLPAFDTAGDARLSAAVDNWMARLGFEMKKSGWTTAVLPPLSGTGPAVSLDKSVLTTGTLQWPPEGEKRLVSTPNPNFFVLAEPTGLVTSLWYTGPTTGVSLVTLRDVYKMDVSFIPQSFFDQFGDATDRNYRLFVNQSKYYVIPDQHNAPVPADYAQKHYAELVPSRATFGSFDSTSGQSYWSDGSDIFIIPPQNEMASRFELLSRSNTLRTPSSGISLNTERSLSAALIELFAQRENRAVTSDDVSKFITQSVDQAASRTDGALSQWTGLAQSQQTVVKIKTGEYTEYLKAVFAALEMQMQSLVRAAQNIT